MRWDNLTVGEDEGARLPGYRDLATVRRFEAPEALDIRFYEIHAKSAITQVPKASQMPFRWTINPYRGCTHACTHGARDQRRSPVPHAARLEACARHAARARTPAAPDDRQRAAGNRPVRGGSAALARLRARLPLRDRARRRHLGTYTYDRPSRASPDVVHRFRLALCDEEALQRAECYLTAHGVHATSFAFHAGSDRTLA